MLFDIKRWNKLNITKEINKILVSDIKFKFVVQGLLGFVLKGNFKPISKKWNARVSKVTIHDIKNVHILHYVGGKGRNPWEQEMRFIEIWKEFYETFFLDAKNKILADNPSYTFSCFSLFSRVFQLKYGKCCFKNFIF